MLAVVGIGYAVVFEALGIRRAGSIENLKRAGNITRAAQPKIEPLIKLGVLVVQNVEPDVVR